MRSAQTSGRATGMLLLAIALWAGNVVVTRAIRSEMAPLWMAYWRWQLAGLVVLPWLGPALWRARQQLWSQRGLLLLLAFVGITGNNGCIYLGIVQTSASSAAALQTFTPVWIALMGHLFFGQRLCGWGWGGVTLSIIGGLVIAGQGALPFASGAGFGVGEAWILLGSLLWALYTLLMARLSPTLDRKLGLAVQMLAGATLLLPLAWYAAPPVGSPVFSWTVVAALAFMGIFASALAYDCYGRAVDVLGSTVAGNYMNLLPAFSSFFSFLFLGETLAPFHLAGFALIAAGLLLVSGQGPRLAEGMRIWLALLTPQAHIRFR
ncbi:DMT family transporter [Gulbenkiania mobilis]|uniref:Threonine/homoserine efflux transporter RhtA n=1 Tax=Gulbenkiania mobilis TaxID=397457 RepID=A0ABY2CWK9_GULMO|nr:DMT family transporter [Gulbenkiania mobilis]TCW31466.1 threonine/homoserine efflux transporter RhtA [Gulbenkiania mobilis]